MDQPTNLKLHISGTEQNVSQAANAAVRIINQDCRRQYFESRVKDMLENPFNFKKSDDSNIVEFSLDVECYWAFEEADISQIANAIIQASPDVKFHLFAQITMTYWDGYDTCVDINYSSGQTTVNVSYDEYDDDEEDDDEKDDDEDGA